MSQPEPTHGWAYPANQPESVWASAHFYPTNTKFQVSLCRRKSYLGQPLHSTVRPADPCKSCQQIAIENGYTQ